MAGDPKVLNAEGRSNTFKHWKLAWIRVGKNFFSEKKNVNQIQFLFLKFFKIRYVTKGEILKLFIVFRGNEVKKAPNADVKT